MHIYLLRHPQTDWNKEMRFQGRIDIPINEKGWQALKQALPILAALPVKVVYTSPLQRAKVVAEKIVQRNGLPLVEDERLIEAHCGRWEGKTVKELTEEEPEAFRLWWQNPYKNPMPEGESYADVEKRTSAFLEDVITRGEDALVVSHGIAIITMLRYVLQIPEDFTRVIRIENLGLARLEFDQWGKAFVVSNPGRVLELLSFPI
ncbi:histidine phosphatase family protein [Coprothermobacteraceae bacterium]|nr:histidine phosphatase family protein [Coprothermobacteraceae bacterium]